MATLKELSTRPLGLTPGHRLCAGCGAAPVVRQILMASDKPVIVANATGCLEVSTTVYPYTAWAVPWIHSAFENAAATMSGVTAAYESLKKQGKLTDDINFVVFGGDGGTYDIGLQSLSGAMERGHDMVYVCYDNGAYMNTGIQRSSATPRGADTTTSPVGAVSTGKQMGRKDLTEIMAAHGIRYVAQVSPSHWNDLVGKAKKAFDVKGPAFINALASCNRGWRHEPADTISVMRLGVDCCYWPLYEIEDGKVRITYKPRDKKPLEDFLKAQGRFRHLMKPENRHLIDEMQGDVDQRWEALRRRAGDID
jgi:pyruvate ferredoxin oxidoreductase beta subunit